MSIITENNINNYKVVNGDGVDASIINDTVETAVNAYSNSQNAISNSNQAVNTANLADKKIEEFIKTEGNSVVTIGGVPQVTWSADFPESERQKSKNLFNYNNYSSLNYGLSLTGSNQFSIVDCQFYYTQGVYVVSLQQGKQYTWSINIDSYSNSDSSTVSSEIVLFSAGNSTQTISLGSITEIKRYSKTFIPNFDVVKIEIRPFRKNNSTSILNGSISNLMLCEGLETDYQEYNGEIVHKNDVSDVEHIETIYDMSSNDSNINLGYNSGIVIGTEVSINMTNYKKIIIVSSRGETTLETSIHLWKTINTGILCGGSTVLDIGGAYFIIHNFTISTSRTVLTFLNGGYFYIDTAGSVFRQETSSSNNKIVKIYGVK